MITKLLRLFGFFQCYVCGKWSFFSGRFKYDEEVTCTRAVCQSAAKYKHDFLPKSPDYERLSEWEEAVKNAGRVIEP
jgi:hypothetical protein